MGPLEASPMIIKWYTTRLERALHSPEPVARVRSAALRWSTQNLACGYRRPALFSSEFRAWCSSILRYVWYRNPFSAARVLARVRSSPASRMVIVGEAQAWLARSRATRATVPLPSLFVALASSNRSAMSS